MRAVVILRAVTRNCPCKPGWVHICDKLSDSNKRALLSCQRDIDHPLMRVSGRPTSGGLTESDSGCRPFPKGLVALYRGEDKCRQAPNLIKSCARPSNLQPGAD